MVSGGASVDDSTILAYNADSPSQVGGLSHWPAGKHTPGELRPTYRWDDGAYLGAIPQPPETYTVVGNTNEHQLSITETTFGGLQSLDGTRYTVCHDTYGCLDYGQLIYVTLARAKNARQAIQVIDDLLQTYGYASSGESFSIADTSEVWLMEIIGKGNTTKGAVWVATRIPDGHVCAHANQARTREFIVGDPDRFQYSKDVVEFARSLGLYTGPDHRFSFSDVFDPVTTYGARTCEARVYSLFSRVAAPEENMEQYLDYVTGYNIKNRMPLYIRPARKISVNDTFWIMRDHYENTALDNKDDISGGPWRSPIQLGSEGKVWGFDGRRYINERPVGVPFTHWNLVANQRPNQKFGVLWFGVDDSTFTLRAPFYGVTNRVPKAWDDANCTSRDKCKEEFGIPGTIDKFSFDSMFWVTNLVANYAYSRFDEIAPFVHERLAKVESRLIAEVEAQDAKFAGLNDEQAKQAATDFSFRTSEALHGEWLSFFGELFATFVDGYRMVPKGDGVAKVGNNLRSLIKAEIAWQTGKRYVLPGKPAGSESNLASVIDKRQLRSMGRTDDVEEEAVEDVAALKDALGLFDPLHNPFIVLPGLTLTIAAIFSFGVAVGRRRGSNTIGGNALAEPLVANV
jgi:dipeptidase